MMRHRQVEQAALFYAFSPETHVSADHLRRSVDRFVDLQEIGGDPAPWLLEMMDAKWLQN